MAEGISAPSDPLLERDAELAAIERALGEARSGRGRLILVEGSPGVGKSTLLAAARERARSAGFSVLEAAGDEVEAAFPFGLAVQLLEPALAAAGDARRRDLLDGPAGLAAALFGDAGSGGAEPPADASFARVHGLTWLCSNLSLHAPLLLSVDDAHWADEPSIAWLRYLSRRLDGLPAVVAAAAWAEDPGGDDSAIRRLHTPAAEVLRPGELTSSATAELARAALGDVATDEVAHACHRATGGNPFFLRELLAELAGLPREDVGARAADLVPGTVSRAVGERLSRLPRPAAALARALAILGEPSALRQAAIVAGSDDVTGAFDTLAGAGFVHAELPPRFVHPLLRVAVQEDMSGGERDRLHGEAAETLAEHGAAPERVAAHLLRSEARGSERAVGILRESARRAQASGQPATAVRYLERAIAERPGRPAAAEMLLELGTAQIEAGDPRAVGTLESTVGMGEPDAVEALRELGRALAVFGRLEDAVDAFDRASAAAEDRRDIRLQIEAELASIQLTLSGGARAVDRLAPYREGLRGRTGGERMLMAVAAFADAQGNRPSGPSADLAARALRGWQERGLRAASLCFYEGVIALMYADRYGEAMGFLDDAVAEARALGSPTGLANASWLRAWTHLRQGNLAEAEAEASVVQDLDDEPSASTPLLRGVLVEILVERGKLEEAERELGADADGEIPAVSLFNPLRYARGRFRIATGRVDHGVQDLLETGRLESEAGGVTPAAFPWRSMAAVACVRSGDVDRARSLVREAVQLARSFGAPRPLGIALRASGVVRGGDAGLEHLRAADSTLERSPARLEHARTLLALGSLLRRSGRSRQARDPLRRALDAADRCGAVPMANRARQELLAAGARPRRTRLRGRDALTPSELRVARMAADGSANRDIAQDLFVTVRTVEGHLSRAYAKLDISSRSELAAALDGRSRRGSDQRSMR